MGVQSALNRVRGEITQKSIPSLKRAGLPGLMREWEAAGANDDAVMAVLHSYAFLRPGWTRVFLIIELIAADIGEKKNLVPPLIDRMMLKRITDTAHHARKIEEGPRHGKRLPKDWHEARAIALNDAEEHVKRLVFNWMHRDKGASGTPM